MISKLAASVRKEYLLLVRDRMGLSILFLMPMVLIFVMTLIQDSAFKTLNEKGIPVVFVNNDKDSLGFLIEKGLRNNDLCSYSDSIHGRPATAETARQAVAEGRFLIGIIIPEGATAAVRKNVNKLIRETIDIDAQSMKYDSSGSDSAEIDILIDPVAKKSFVTAITSSLREFISETKTKIMFGTFSRQIAEIIPDKSREPKNAFAESQIIKYREIYASKTAKMIVPNAVQHNVPAWTIFAMFFIAIPITGSIVKEKSEGSVFRLRTMPSSYLILTGGKLIVYLGVCLVQFLLMISVGLYFLPMLGLPSLVLGSSFWGIGILTLATALAATGYGVLVGTLATTEQQGAIMGSLSILLLSALGGIWVPTYVMPESMRAISVFSPMNWSLDGYYKLFLRGSNAMAILADAMKLVAFSIATMAISSFTNRIKRKV
ncbi:MAG: ABC transporter permease [Bacteroidota bacterium]|nr:ABC transporter permease [Bacteroidota bacterium]MDP4212321.1 ABC transporter permease [Bacteroidota bacterium]